MPQENASIYRRFVLSFRSFGRIVCTTICCNCPQSYFSTCYATVNACRRYHVQMQGTSTHGTAILSTKLYITSPITWLMVSRRHGTCRSIKMPHSSIWLIIVHFIPQGGVSTIFDSGTFLGCESSKSFLNNACSASKTAECLLSSCGILRLDWPHMNPGKSNNRPF